MIKTKKRALITGASRGIGQAIAERFAMDGYDLILVCEKEEALLRRHSTRWMNDYCIDCQVFRLDISDEASVLEIFRQIDSLDLVINNAAISRVGLLQDMNAQDWKRLLSVNLDACFYVCKQAIPFLLAAKEGRILNISSVWGNVGASMEVAYSASKGAVNAFTKALGKELAPANISVNAIALGVVDTSMNQQLDDEEQDALKQSIPIGRFATPEEAAELTWLIAQSPLYLTAQVITMDGGWT
ncbi:MAG: SDR family NAD(P)-dependent oxidoreductase [Clostridium sp.]|jgi:3-oxoacyl-[acyl-carrier protein] reductase|nr:SDR family NAD(P)-dependent oxidoreductase [Clostridium sp.]